jgi:hypothetical protein
MNKLAQESLAVATAIAEGSADGPDAGIVAAGAGALGGAWGSLIALAIVGIFGLGDDFIGQNATLLFSTPADVVTPKAIGQFRGMSYNTEFTIGGDTEGKYTLYFDILVVETIKKKV